MVIKRSGQLQATHIKKSLSSLKSQPDIIFKLKVSRSSSITCIKFFLTKDSTEFGPSLLLKILIYFASSQYTRRPRPPTLAPPSANWVRDLNRKEAQAQYKMELQGVARAHVVQLHREQVALQQQA